MITKFLDDVVHGRDVPGLTDTSLFCQLMQRRPRREKLSVVFIRDNPSHECNSILVSFMKKLNSLAGEVFPKTVADLARIDLDFLVRAQKNI